MDTMNWTTDDSRSSESGNTSSSGVRDEHASGRGASTSEGTYARSGVFARGSATDSSSASTEDSLALAKSYSETARRLDELSQQLSRDASYAETHGMQLSENLSQDLAQWYRHQQVANPGLDAPELWATDLTDQQLAVRQEMITRWMGEKQASIRSDIEGRLHAPDLVDVHHPSVDSAADVRAAYQPHGVAGPPAGPGSGQSSAAADLIKEGRADIDRTREAAQSLRGQRVQGAVDIQSEVSRGQDHGFFHDPKLRE
jgi:conjugal transfer mating pair stabilization protein TraG